MADYLAQRIIDGAFDNSKEGMTGYKYVISKRPDLKNGIDAYLTEQGKADLIATS
jgi:hypothetical protein